MNDQQRLEQLAIASLRMQPCPDGERLAAYAARTLPGLEHLIVAAHVRRCPLCARDLELSQLPDLGDPWLLDDHAVPTPRFAIARLLEQAQSYALRTEHGREAIRQYVAADVVLSVSITPTGCGDARGPAWRSAQGASDLSAVADES